MLATNRIVARAALLSIAMSTTAAAQSSTTTDAHWIWSPAYEQNEAPAGVCYFRKAFTAKRQTLSAVVHIAADNRYQLFVNGRLIGSGGDWRKMDTFDIADRLRVGRNVIAVRAENTEPGPAGLVARVVINERGGTGYSLSTDDTWKSSVNEFRDWNRAALDDSDWLAAKSLGLLGTVLPWGNEVVVAAEGARFTIDPEFRITRIANDAMTGSVVAMTINARGELIVSQERGPLLLLADGDGDGVIETRKVFSDQINTAQGILPLGADVYAVGTGPQGLGLYRLRDENGDGQADGDAAPMLKFKGRATEHGPHAVRLGPDGKLYVLSGNHSQVEAAISPRSPYRHWHEGDVVTPRYEDPRGHAVGLTAPGGTITRVDLRGGQPELVAGGMRNSYDFAFDQFGEIFTYDSDMEWDRGTPWYRPTRISHTPLGAELGWRSGWAKWPDYWLDSLPATVNIGPGSPTGVVHYQHNAFPVRLHNTLFAADWARGEIHAVKLRRTGGSYQATSSVFLKGRPMAVTDLAVGPRGALYFCTGGRGTEGGVYRIEWTGKVPPIDAGQGIDRALRQPQPDADWAREAISQVRRELGERWASELVRAASETTRPVEERIRALGLMTLYGQAPSGELLAELSRDESPLIRAAVTKRFAVTNQTVPPQLWELLADADAGVRRAACETLAQFNRLPANENLIQRLADEDRHVRFAARRTLEQTDLARLRDSILRAATPAVFLNGSVVLLTAAPDHNTSLEILARCQQLLSQQLSERDFLDLLRVAQLALVRGMVEPEEVIPLRDQLVAEYPTADPRMNAELVRLLVRLQAPEAASAMSRRLAEAEDLERFHIGAYATRLRVGWNTQDKLAMLRFYEAVREMKGGYSATAYVEGFAREFFTNLTLPERQQVIAAGERFPTSALSIIARLPEQPGADVLASLRDLDRRLEAYEGDVFDRLQVGIVAALARSNEEESVRYLHALYEADPPRRAPIAMALTQHPEGANWPVLVDALNVLETAAAREVLAALGRVRIRPREATPYRNVILQGLRSDGAGPKDADQLLSFWVGAPAEVASAATPEDRMKGWQAWYTAAFPNERPANPPTSKVANRWSFEELLSHLKGDSEGDLANGERVFESATCIKCHRHGQRGETIGPDLSTVARRFQTKEVLEAIVYPSHVVSDQYASKTIVASGRSYVGVAVADGPDRVVVLTNEGKRVSLNRTDIEAVSPSADSSMPEGLLNPLTLQEVSDLFAYLMTERE